MANNSLLSYSEKPHFSEPERLTLDDKMRLFAQVLLLALMLPLAASGNSEEFDREKHIASTPLIAVGHLTVQERLAPPPEAPADSSIGGTLHVTRVLKNTLNTNAVAGTNIVVAVGLSKAQWARLNPNRTSSVQLWYLNPGWGGTLWAAFSSTNQIPETIRIIEKQNQQGGASNQVAPRYLPKAVPLAKP